MEIEEHLAQLEADGSLLAAAADRAGWDAPVPGTEWDVRELVTHIGGVHRYATAVVRENASSGDVAEARAVGTGPPDDELLGWFIDGHAELVATLRAAPDDLACFTFFAAPSPLAFWTRRQAHETAIHRADAEAAAGGVASFPAPFAQDGVAEVLHGFAARRSNAIDLPGVLALRADDGPDWRIDFGGERIVAAQDPAADADAVVAGTSAELYLWLWNRPSPAVVGGDADLAALWRRVRVRWG